MLSFFYCFSVFMLTGEKDSNTLHVFFENGEKNLRFENIRIRVDSA